MLLPGKSHGRRNLVGCSPWGCEESDTTEQLHFHFSLSCIGEGNGNPLQCSCLENLRDGGAWWAAVYGVAQSRTWLKWLSSSGSRHKSPQWLSCGTELVYKHQGRLFMEERLQNKIKNRKKTSIYGRSDKVAIKSRNSCGDGRYWEKLQLMVCAVSWYTSCSWVLTIEFPPKASELCFCGAEVCTNNWTSSMDCPQIMWSTCFTISAI